MLVHDEEARLFRGLAKVKGAALPGVCIARRIRYWVNCQEADGRMVAVAVGQKAVHGEPLRFRARFETPGKAKVQLLLRNDQGSSWNAEHKEALPGWEWRDSGMRPERSPGGPAADGPQPILPGEENFPPVQPINVKSTQWAALRSSNDP
jgi:hypothetical protein